MYINENKKISGDGNGVALSKLKLYAPKVPFYRVYLIVKNEVYDAYEKWLENQNG